MYQFEKIGKSLLGTKIEDALMEFIQKEPVAVGQKIPNEFELAEKFNVGRSTIREAVKSLASKGILEVRRGSGTFVVSTSSLEEDPLGLGKLEDPYQLALELLEVRLMLEPEIAALACKFASEEEKKQLETLCVQVEEQYRAGISHIKKDIEFHTCIARCSRNRVVEILIPLINSGVSAFANLTHRRLMEETIGTHRAITDAIISGDSLGAKCAMVMHLTYNRQTLMKLSSEQAAEKTEKTVK